MDVKDQTLAKEARNSGLLLSLSQSPSKANRRSTFQVEIQTISTKIFIKQVASPRRAPSSDNHDYDNRHRHVCDQLSA